MEAEAASEKKPGNRGKRDSQLVMMNFFSRITYKDPFSPLDYDMFRKIRVLMGVTPDLFEVTLMVRALLVGLLLRTQTSDPGGC
jgi:chitin synthase